MKAQGYSVDGQLPPWARRSNPIVRRHLGSTWRTFVPNFRELVPLLLIPLAVLALSLLSPRLLEFTTPAVPVALVILPAAAFLYGQILFRVGAQAAIFWVDEMRNGTLALTLIIPQTLRHTIYAKMAAALWRHVENLMLLAKTTTLITLPLVVLLYAGFFTARPSDLALCGAAAVAVFSSVARLWLEPVMVAALGGLFGAMNTARTPAVVAATVATVAYFLIITLPRLLPLSLGGRVLVETLLPVLAPIVITAAAIRLTERAVLRDDRQ